MTTPALLRLSMVLLLALPAAQASVLRFDDVHASAPLADATGAAPEGEWLHHPTNLVYTRDDAGELRLSGATAGPHGYYSAIPVPATDRVPLAQGFTLGRLGCDHPGDLFCVHVNVALVGDYTIWLRSMVVCTEDPWRASLGMPVPYVEVDVLPGYWSFPGEQVSTVRETVRGYHDWELGCKAGYVETWLMAAPESRPDLLGEPAYDYYPSEVVGVHFPMTGNAPLEG